MPTVTWLGDSEAYGFTLARSQCPAAQLAQILGGGAPTITTLAPWSGALSTTGAQRVFTSGAWVVRDAGVPSDTTRGMRARWSTDVLGGQKPDYVLLGPAGENDLYWSAPAESGCGGGGDTTYGVDYNPGGLIDNVTWMINAGLAAGVIPLLVTPLPHGGLDGCPTRWQGMQDYLKWLGTSMTWMSTSHAVNSLGRPLVDAYQAVYDPAHPAYPLSYPSGSPNSIDNIHPSVTGAGLIAAAARTAILANPNLSLVLGAAAGWAQNGQAITVTGLIPSVRNAVPAQVNSTAGGPVLFTGAHASRFQASLNGTSWASTITVPAGQTSIYLAVTAQSGDTSLSAQVAVPR